MLSYLQAVSSYFNQCRLICELYCPISTHVVLFASYVILFTTDILLFSSYIIFVQASVSSDFHPIHHPIFNSYQDITTSYQNLFANIFPPYLQLCHAILIYLSYLLTLKTYRTISGIMPLQHHNNHHKLPMAWRR